MKKLRYSKKKLFGFVRFIFGIYFLLVMSFFMLVLSSRASFRDVFTTGRVSVLENRSSKITHDIIVDASMLNNCPGGIAVLTKDILQKMAQARPNWRFNVLTYEESRTFTELQALENVNFIMVRLFYHPSYDSLFNLLNFATFGFFKDKLLQLIYYNTIFLDSECDLFWDPDGEDSVVNNFSIPKVATIHDLLHVESPELGSCEKSIDLSKKRTLESVKYSDKIITVSNFQKKRIVDRYGVSENFVQAIPIQHADRLHFQLTQQEINTTLEKYNVSPQKYIIFVSQYFKHKNHRRLIQAFSKIVDRIGANENLKLVLVGNMKRAEGELEKFAAQYSIKNNIIFTGGISDKDLQILLSNALCFVHPSLYEGFGMPVVEAMASGIPVACSNQTSLPEVAGEAALYFDPYNIDEMADAISKIVENPLLRADLIKKGFEQAKKFRDTDAMIDEYVKVFEEVMEKRKIQ